MRLPSKIPVFALPNVVLFPGVPLPLHIFEPRYRDMVADALAGDNVVGMTLLRGNWQSDYEGRPSIFEIGCAGKIVSADKLPDGRFNILLQGICEFAVTRHVFEHSYREALVEWRTLPTNKLTAALRPALVQSLSEFLDTVPESPAHRLLRDPSLSDESLVNLFSYALDITPLEKQGLLEAASLDGRAARLIESLEFRLEESRLTVGGSGGEKYH
ncbi:MAG: LON peptidase substrate-binding domain-containing protein [Deltaproteobacteria bacterium]|nr:LON peptidase substrate-binding domain-containing protein [Deltaproteobacteria bacterium]